ACAGFRIDSIAQIVPSGAVRFVLTSGAGVDSLVIATAPRLPNAQWGYTYSLPLKSACGTGALSWSLDSGGPPPGTGLSAAGVVTGPPADTGTYTFAAKLKSGTDSARRVFTLRVREPVLTLQQVLTVGFQGPQPLQCHDLRRRRSPWRGVSRVRATSLVHQMARHRHRPDRQRRGRGARGTEDGDGEPVRRDDPRRR